jgi:hypothetical protein
MKKITLLLFALLFSWQFSAQTIVIGTGTGTTTSTGNDPIDGYYNSFRYQVVYTAAELSAMLTPYDEITSLGFSIAGDYGGGNLLGYTIKMGHTTATNSATHDASTTTTVKFPFNYNPTVTAAGVFDMITLDSNFIWNGVDNVLVDICSSGSNPFSTPYGQVRTNTITNGSRFYRLDGGNACGVNTTTTNGDRPNIQFNYIEGTPPSCLPTTGLAASNITANGVETSWFDASAPGVVGYEYAITTSATPPASGTQTTDAFYIQPTGLTPQTVYFLHVRVECAGSTYSSWSTISFTTTCATVSAFSENFDSVTTPNLPSCWGKIISGTGVSAFAAVGTATTNVSAPNGVNLYNDDSAASANIILVSPLLNNLSAGTHRLKFKARNSLATQDLQIGVLTNPADASTFTLVQAVDINATFQEYVVNFDVFTGPGSAIAIKRLSTSTYTNVYLDDIVWEVLPSCPDQTGLTAANITANGVETSWFDTGAIGYQYAITTSATPPASGTQTTDTFYIQSTGLTPQTVYYLHVRSECAGSTYGNWATISFTTSCVAVVALPWTEGFEGLALGDNIFPSCWGYSNTTSVWNIETTPVANTGANSLGRTWSTDGWAFTPTFTLTAGTSYRFSYYMRTVDAFVGYNVTVGVGTGQNSAAMTTTLGTPLTGFQNPTWTKYNFEFTPGSTGDYSFGVRAVAPTSDPNGINFDDFRLELTPTCPDQTGLTFSNVTFSSVETSWDAMPSVVGYEYAITTSATPPASGTSTIDNFYIQSSGLTPQTVYYLHVRSQCAGSTYGNWSTISFFTGYCKPSSTGSASYVNNFTTTGGSQNISNVATGFTASGYLDASTQFVEGYATSSFNFTGTIVGGTVGFSIWIDWNNDLTFNNATEKVYNTTSYGSGPFTGLITIPPGTPIGNYRMRITTDYNQSNPSNPCAAAARAEFEDYTVSVIAAPACVPTNASATGVTHSDANISWAAVPSATSGYEYVLDNLATNPAGSGISTMAITYPASGLTQLTTYYFHVRSVCSLGTYSTWNTISFTTLATPPANDNCLNAIALNVNADYLCGDFVSGTTVGATNSGVEPALAVSGTPDNDVWYSFVATHAAHRITLTNVVAVTGTSVDMGIGVYNGPCASLTLVGSSDPNTYNLTGLTPGNTYLVNVYGWYANGVTEANATFNICVGTDPVLSSVSFDKSSFVAYPNPVKDVLNLSYKTEISNVRIINLLGQEVLNTKTNTNDVQVNMSALTAGAYIVNITVEDTVHTIKVIKE